MGHTPRVSALVAALGLLVAACTVQPGVEHVASERTPAAPGGETEPPPTSIPVSPTTEPATPTSVPTETAALIDFGPCDEFVRGNELPPPDGWECGVVETPMDPNDPTGDVVELAVTRLPGNRSAGTALVVNPGGPGGAGLPFVWAIADTMPAEVRRGFDIVSWDPRGVGVSAPAITCPRRSRWADEDLLARCGEATGDLMAHLGTVNHADDLEALRSALEQERLNYVGYSYGTYLGAVYASRHPGRVGRFVLDGAVDPTSGSADSPIHNGAPWYASDGSADVLARFFALCDAAEACALGTDSAGSYDDLSATVGALPTDGYAGVDRVDDVTLDAVLDTSMFDPFNWGVLATALEDAAAGDGSTLDALADLLEVSSNYFGEIVDLRSDNETIANLSIYCADFQTHPLAPDYCGGIPPNEVSWSEIGRVDVELPILVIGTELDPSTPVEHAASLSNALGDAVSLYWDGIGHTAFPGQSLCIDDTVAAFLLDDVVPDEGIHCEFVAGVDDEVDADVGDYLFALPPAYVEPWLASALSERSVEDADCRAAELSVAGDRIVVHVVLGVQSPAALAASDKARAVCEQR